jgi:methionyl-tRNA synthetase
LTAVMPETRDSDWSWEGYVERNNAELVATWGNLVNRVLQMTQRYFGGVVPEPGALTEKDRSLLLAVDSAFDTVGTLYDGCKFRAAVQETLAAATRVNQYLEETSPWTTAKTDREATGRSLYTAIQAINGLKVLFAPVLPFTSEALHGMLGEEGRLFGRPVVETYQETTRSHTALTYDAAGAVGKWEREEIAVGRLLPAPRPLFRKLEPVVAEEELGRLRPSG